jgi:hypothetical protein
MGWASGRLGMFRSALRIAAQRCLDRLVRLWGIHRAGGAGTSVGTARRGRGTVPKRTP